MSCLSGEAAGILDCNGACLQRCRRGWGYWVRNSTCLDPCQGEGFTGIALLESRYACRTGRSDRQAYPWRCWGQWWGTRAYGACQGWFLNWRQASAAELFGEECRAALEGYYYTLAPMLHTGLSIATLCVKAAKLCGFEASLDFSLFHSPNYSIESTKVSTPNNSILVALACRSPQSRAEPIVPAQTAPRNREQFHDSISTAYLPPTKPASFRPKLGLVPTCMRTTSTATVSELHQR